MDIIEIRTAVAEQRKAKKLTQTQLGEAANLSREMISRFENDAHDIGLRRLLRMCEALGLELIVRPGRGRPTLEDLASLFHEDD